MWWHEFMNLALINSDANCDQQPLRVLPIIEHAQHACIITHFFAWGYANCQKKPHLLYVFPSVDKCTFAVRISVNTACVIHKTTVCPVCKYFYATSTNNAKGVNPSCSLKQKKVVSRRLKYAYDFGVHNFVYENSCWFVSCINSYHSPLLHIFWGRHHITASCLVN